MEAINLFVKTDARLVAGIEELIEAGRLRHETITLDAGDYLFREGSDVAQTFFVKQGLIKLFSDTSEGYAKTVFLHKAGTLIGFQCFQEREDQSRSILNARATMKSTVIAINAADFSACLKEDGEFAFAMIRYMFSMLALQTREAVNSSMYSVLQRFAALLLKLAEELGGAADPVLIPFGNAEFAEMLGVHVNSIANAVSSLRKSGCVDKQRGYLAIIDTAKLRGIAENLIADE